MSVLKTRFAARAAKSLRLTMTDAERRIWSRLRNRQLLGFKFVRQQPVGPYIVDFACREADLAVELDGGQHADSTADLRRTAALAALGYEVMRFWNIDVLNNTDGVIEAIALRLTKAPSPGWRFSPADLSPEGRGKEAPGLTSPLGERSDCVSNPGEGASQSGRNGGGAAP